MDVYKKPESELIEQTMENVKPHGFWRLFFWLHVLLTPLILSGLLFIEDLTVFDYLDLATLLPILVVLYGYSYSKTIGPQFLWRAFRFYYPVWVIFYDVVVAFVLKVPQYGQIAIIDEWLLIIPIFVIPTCLVIWRYASNTNNNKQS